MTKVIYKRLKELREAKGLTQLQLAESLGIGRVSVSNYENGDRTFDAEQVIKFADFFGVTTDYLLGRSEFKNYGQEYDFRKRLAPEFFTHFDDLTVLYGNTNSSPDPHELNPLMVSIDENYSSIITEIITGNEEFRMGLLISLEKLLKVLVFTVDFFKDEEDIRAYDDNTLRYIEFLKKFIDVPDLSNLDFGYIQSNEEKIRGCATCFNEFITLFVCSIIDFEKSRRAETTRSGLKNALIDKILDKLI